MIITAKDQWEGSPGGQEPGPLPSACPAPGKDTPTHTHTRLEGGLGKLPQHHKAQGPSLSPRLRLTSSRLVPTLLLSFVHSTTSLRVVLGCV